MGQAKQKHAALLNWKEMLSADERTIFAVAEAVHKNIVKALGATGMCYRIAFFLAELLRHEHGIITEPVVGFVNDGESALMISHAWIDFNGKKTDLSLTQTENPAVQLPGSLLILDRAFGISRANYAYHRKQSEASSRLVESLRRDVQYAEAVAHKEREHQRMTEIAASWPAIRVYLDSSPDGLGYEALTSWAGINRQYPG
jgi:hypothetical protein